MIWVSSIITVIHPYFFEKWSHHLGNGKCSCYYTTTAYRHFMGECKMFVDMQNSDTATHKWANVAWLTGWYMAANCYAVISATLKRHSILACVVLSFKIGSSNLLFRSNLTHFDSSKKTNIIPFFLHLRTFLQLKIPKYENILILFWMYFYD